MWAYPWLSEYGKPCSRRRPCLNRLACPAEKSPACETGGALRLSLGYRRAPPGSGRFLDAIHKHSGFCQAEHLDGYAAQQQPRQAAAAVAADEDKVAAFFFGSLHQAVGHVEVGDRLGLGLDACGFGTVEHRLQVFLSLLLRGLVVVFIGDGISGSHAVETDRSGKRLGYVQGDDFGTRFASKADTFVGSLRRQGRAVGWNKYFLEHSVGSQSL